MNSSDEHSEGEVERSAQFWIEGVLTPLVGISGVAGDTLHTCNIFIMLKTLILRSNSLFIFRKHYLYSGVDEEEKRTRIKTQLHSSVNPSGEFYFKV